ncbi:hypothetical protein RHMOL_Rhmol06G0015900 [Rhododendron molle]|uniref:Uncharacterized protein n=1 Tax=Rhododendron molle TaxID=49168 RepID=A0ACC0N9Q9_RHOML|nr:hypothetical protein RHMOL_Rhmol06G0015900 [Rhododendron molle]
MIQEVGGDDNATLTPTRSSREPEGGLLLESRSIFKISSTIATAKITCGDHRSRSTTSSSAKSSPSPRTTPMTARASTT